MTMLTHRLQWGPLVLALLLGLPAFAQDAAAGRKKAEPCAACHGANGVASLPNTPSLAGQPEMYLTFQLILFREKQRANTPEMTAITSGLSDDDIRDLASHYSSLPPPPAAADAGDAARITRGREVGEKNNCNSCHQGDYSGQQQMPRLASQREDYLVKAMTDYRDAKRAGLDGQMTGILRGFSDADIAALAHFLARQK